MISEHPPSFNRIDYSVRPNKNIERKLVFDALVRIHSAMPLSNHRYTGFGSMWFGDFLLAHRLLGLEEMWSIEHDEHAPRAEFNQPYRTITIKPGESTDVLRNMTAVEWAKPSIFWLDYDGLLSDEVVEDIQLVVNNAAVSSVFIVTLNAKRGSYGRSQLSRVRIEKLLGAGSLPARFLLNNGQPLPATQDVDVNEFPEFLAEAVLNFIKHRTTTSGRNGPTFRFEPLFNCCHIDGADMVTIGGAFLTDVLAPGVRSAVADLLPQDPTTSYPQHKRFDIPQLTLREKIALDRVLPHSEAEYLAAAVAAGLKLSEDAIKKYRECYRHFPVFGEMFF